MDTLKIYDSFGDLLLETDGVIIITFKGKQYAVTNETLVSALRQKHERTVNRSKSKENFKLLRSKTREFENSIHTQIKEFEEKHNVDLLVRYRPDVKFGLMVEYTSLKEERSDLSSESDQ